MSTVHHGPQSCRADPSTDTRRLRYTRVAMVLHWTVAVMIAINIVLIWIVELIPEGFVRPAIDTHKSLGITVMGLVLLHLLWRAANPPPALPAAYPSWERRIAKIAHVTMYTLILALPLSGWLHDSFAFSAQAIAHCRRGHRLRRNLRGERKAREEFLQLHVDEVYDKLTCCSREFTRAEQLVADAALAFPGLVPTQAVIARDNGKMQSAKEAYEINQGIFLAHVLANDKTGRHLTEWTENLGPADHVFLASSARRQRSQSTLSGKWR